MKRVMMLALAILATPMFFASAQAPQRPRPQLQGLPPQLEKNRAEMKAALDTEPVGEPSADLNVSEFQLKRNDLKGNVVELTFDKVVTLKQAGQEGYIAMVTYESPRMAEGLNIIVPSAGLEFFEELSKINYPRKGTVYIQVLNPSTVKALGTRYSKNKPEGERYSW